MEGDLFLKSNQAISGFIVFHAVTSLSFLIKQYDTVYLILKRIIYRVYLFSFVLCFDFSFL